MRNLGVWTLVAGVAATTVGVIPLAAQVREGARAPLDTVRVVFDYVCDDRFVVSNEGTEAVRLEYGVDRSDSRTELSLAGRESVELLLSTSDQLNLMMDGRVIASAHNAGRDCEDREPRVVVRRAVVIEPRIIIVRPTRYYDSGWWYRHHHHHRPVVQTVIRVPIIIGRSSRDRDRGRDHDRGRDNDRGRGKDRGRSDDRAWGRGR